MPPRTALSLLLALCLPFPAGAAIVHRCESDSGHITFTTLGCAPNETLQPQRAHNPAPGSRPVPASSPKPATTAARELIVVGEHDDGCANLLSPQEKRRAIIHQQVRPGMNRLEVESALGRPDRISTTNNAMRYHYTLKKGRSSLVVLDEKGCVKR
ncbi:outer membrane protein assembly factor BamE [Pseudomonas gingeri]|uniref:Outer membrane protein assembly factor BamE n=1 Tax=Pseudomonas gingeri TaxID=117681 RepID=A0A7Y7XJ90_9PSED|nr:outer membrane protein assembly factor BamE [Pseudomonas gingeri]NWA29832.1 outer membrane protein assembly factor BamE [Pseudomonas gingeri]NWC00851.1 outer membrane protein assembly factor BamE [Pseudomonas gingeri]NWD77814.1 outer membrane protein assembly factor BamE [Pseudomonas gingeri]